MRISIKENVVFPFSDPSWIGKVLMGFVCQLFALPLPILFGYQFKVIREAANGEDEKLPEFDNLGSLWVQGFIFLIVLTLLVFLPLLFVVAGLIGAGLAVGDNPAALWGMTGLTVIAIGGLILAILFFAPALMLRYAMTGNVSSLFDLPTAWGDIQQGPTDYLAVSLFPVVATILVLVTGIGAILIPLISILIMFIQARMIGNYYRLYFQ